MTCDLSPCVVIVAISCSNPGDLAYGTRSGSNITYLKSVMYQCARGYQLVGHARLSCQADGKWNGSLPMCKPVVCPELVTPAWSKRNSSNFTFASVVRFQCARGFDVSGSSLLECMWNRQWTYPMPQCTPVTCGDLKIPTNAQLVSINSSFAGVAVLACRDGYLLNKTLTRWRVLCQASGQWSNVTAQCKGELYLQIVSLLAADFYTSPPVCCECLATLHIMKCLVMDCGESWERDQ